MNPDRGSQRVNIACIYIAYIHIYIASSNQTGYNFKKVDLVGLRTDLEEIKWNEEMAGLNANEMWGGNFVICYLRQLTNIYLRRL